MAAAVRPACNSVVLACNMRSVGGGSGRVAAAALGHVPPGPCALPLPKSRRCAGLRTHTDRPSAPGSRLWPPDTSRGRRRPPPSPAPAARRSTGAGACLPSAGKVLGPLSCSIIASTLAGTGGHQVGTAAGMSVFPLQAAASLLIWAITSYLQAGFPPSRPRASPRRSERRTAALAMPGADPPLLERLITDVETGKDEEEAGRAPRSPLALSDCPSQLSHLECLLAEEQPMPAGRGPAGETSGCGTGGGVSAAAAARCRRRRLGPCMPALPLQPCCRSAGWW